MSPRIANICRNGHEVIGENAYLNPRGHTECRLCRRAAKLRQKVKGPKPKLVPQPGVPLRAEREYDYWNNKYRATQARLARENNMFLQLVESLPSVEGGVYARRSAA